MGASPQHVTLVANVVSTVTLDRDYASVEVLNRDGAADVWFRFGGLTPAVEGEGSHVVLGAAGSALTVEPGTSNNTVVKLLATAPVKVSVRGVP